MSNVSHYVRGLRSGIKFGDQTIQDRVVLDGLWCAFGHCHMGGHAEYHLCRHLAKEGASLSVADIEGDRIRKAVSDFGATVVAADDVYGIGADIFSPCALGAVINVGGWCNVYGELEGWTASQSMEKAGGIYDSLLQIFEHAREENIPTSQAADSVARRRIAEARRVRDA